MTNKQVCKLIQKALFKDDVIVKQEKIDFEKHNQLFEIMRCLSQCVVFNYCKNVDFKMYENLIDSIKVDEIDEVE